MLVGPEAGAARSGAAVLGLESRGGRRLRDVLPLVAAGMSSSKGSGSAVGARSTLGVRSALGVRRDVDDGAGGVNSTSDGIDPPLGALMTGSPLRVEPSRMTAGPGPGSTTAEPVPPQLEQPPPAPLQLVQGLGATIARGAARTGLKT